ncbi:MAG: hypothetical protein M1817_002766 [Caeruleum heppii]|nr:MAG: hypothetical protein M1817_002766 [Caeruleum heppii]
MGATPGLDSAGPPTESGRNTPIDRTTSPEPLSKPTDLAIESVVNKGPDVIPSKQRVKELKYQLWPSLHPTMNKPPPAPERIVVEEGEKVVAKSIVRPMSPKTAYGMRTLLSTSPVSKMRMSQKRRRKPSVTDLTPMTTLQEMALDSPTIPGRPPLHERSISAPGTSLSPDMPGVIDGVSQSTLLVPNEIVIRTKPSPVNVHTIKRKSLSPPNLTRLVIPSGSPNAPLVARIPSPQPCGSSPRRRVPSPQPSGDVFDDDRPPQPPPKSPRMDGRGSPRPKGPVNPVNASTVSLPSSVSETPITAPEERSAPKPWISPNRSQSPTTYHRTSPDPAATERGRPKQRSDSLPDHSPSVVRKPSPAIPRGHPAVDVASKLSASEVDGLYQQALGQAAQFEVLRAKDVRALSRELRALDERCEYLRKTLDSLRLGRRGLHQRMVAYLKSPRMAKFSRESMIRQEEALAELDTSIDDWVSKLDYAENRRARVRQKLLEHVAAALIMQTPVEETLSSVPTSAASSALVVDDTPPASPERPRTPVRTARCDVESIRIYADTDVYNVYAESDVYALLEDVEQEISKMADSCGSSSHDHHAETWISTFARQ